MVLLLGILEEFSTVLKIKGVVFSNPGSVTTLKKSESSMQTLALKSNLARL